MAAIWAALPRTAVSTYGRCRICGELIALAGVLLELHLAKVATKYGVTRRHTPPGLTLLNAALKRGGIYDGEVWRFIQRLGALGQACVYASTHEPTVDELRVR